jgi:endogenous inhibitor of DNA gyrase (YacG/DUF329 family)
MPGPLTVECPTCGGAVEWSEDARWRPFCSNRCRLVDLGAWFTEERGIPGDEAGDSTPAAAGEDETG